MSSARRAVRRPHVLAEMVCSTSNVNNDKLTDELCVGEAEAGAAMAQKVHKAQGGSAVVLGSDGDILCLAEEARSLPPCHGHARAHGLLGG